ncbi:MAG: HAD hydrolase-like protein [Lachnospiraceae bacterium]|nr:HAD hydrolase-like protein [Lachnospiraceae bacterium]
MFDGIMFDVDGTLWDSTSVVAKAWNKVFEEDGYADFSVTADTLKGLFGRPMPEIINAIMPGVSVEEQEKIAPKCYRYENEYLERESEKIYDGIIETIRELARDHKIFIVSNCQAGYIELLIRKTGIGDIITDHICLGDNDLLKADNIKLMIDKHQLKKPVYIGDIQGDADAAKDAGAAFIHAAYGFGKVTECFAAINEPEELISVINAD